MPPQVWRQVSETWAARGSVGSWSRLRLAGDADELRPAYSGYQVRGAGAADSENADATWRAVADHPHLVRLIRAGGSAAYSVD